MLALSRVPHTRPPLECAFNGRITASSSPAGGVLLDQNSPDLADHIGMPKTDVRSTDHDLGTGSVEPRASDGDQAIARAALRRVAERGDNRVERDAFGG